MPAVDTEYDGMVANNDPCNPAIDIVSSIGGCDLVANSPIWTYLEMIEPYIGVVAAVAGFAACFYGIRMLKPFLFLAGILTCCCLSLLFCYAVYAKSTDDLMSTFYYFLGGGLIAGILLGWLLAKFVKVGAAVLAAWGGMCLGLILNEAVLFQLEAEWVFWTSICLCAVGCAFLTFKLFDWTVICSTAFLGAYMMVRGVSCYAGHYYNEFTMVKLLQSGAYDQIDPYYWIYVAGFFGSGFLGIYLQNKYKPKELQVHPYHTRGRRY